MPSLLYPTAYLIVVAPKEHGILVSEKKQKRQRMNKSFSRVGQFGWITICKINDTLLPDAYSFKNLFPDPAEIISV
jgi:hypothetical protein